MAHGNRPNIKDDIQRRGNYRKICTAQADILCDTLDYDRDSAGDAKQWHEEKWNAM